MDGVLIVDKPSEMTSHDVVAIVRKRLGTRKVGHGGTLDPDATGVLVLGVGAATRFLSFAQAAPKRYRAEGAFGISTTTQDASGEVVESRPASITESEVTAAIASFVGEIKQVPPMVSAVKMGGERLYKKALRGEAVEREPRVVTVHAFDLIEFRTGERPRARFDIVCSGGTYVRTLIHDLGEQLGCGAHMSSLRRTGAGSFTEDDAVALDDVSAEALRPVLDAVRDLPAIEAGPDVAQAVSHGRKLSSSLAPDLDDGRHLAIVSKGTLLAVYRRSEDVLRADRVIAR